MSKQQIVSGISIPHIDPDTISDPTLRAVVQALLGTIEIMATEIRDLREENQRLKNEINHLKGEQGKPTIKGNTRGNYSSTNEQKNAEAGSKEKKKKGSKSHSGSLQSKKLVVDKAILPEDAEFKGFEISVIPEIIFTVEFIKYLREKWYSRSQNKTYIAPLPQGYTREFSASVHAFVLALSKTLKTTESCIKEFLGSAGLPISKATISRMLTQNLDIFHQEHHDIMAAGLKSQSYLQTDDTMARVKGKNYHTHIFCNEFFTAFFTAEKKDRLTVLDLLRLEKPRHYVINDETMEFLKFWNLPKKRMEQLLVYQKDRLYSSAEFEAVLRTIYPDEEHHKTYQTRIKEAAYIAAYHGEEDCILALLSDDAPQFNFIALYHALCWVHEGRHYKKMQPVIPYHKSQLGSFLKQFWNLYRLILNYKKLPSQEGAQEIENKFDELCQFKSSYPELKERIEKTKANRDQLLYVLKDPSVPLHNNNSELSARDKVRNRDIHLHTMSEEGTKAEDAFLTISGTAKKHFVRLIDYILDRITGAFKMPSLASLILAASSARA